MKIQNSSSLNVLMLIVFIACVTSCKKEPSYSLNKEAVTLTSSGTFQLSIEGGAAETFTYASDNNLVATIDASGLITGKRVGETTIKVSGIKIPDTIVSTFIISFICIKISRKKQTRKGVIKIRKHAIIIRKYP